MLRHSTASRGKHEANSGFVLHWLFNIDFAFCGESMTPEEFNQELDLSAACGDFLRSKYGAHRGHPEWRAMEDAFRAGVNWASSMRQLEQEPVAAECKFDREARWVRCEIAHHNLVQSEPEKWPQYQTRLLYTSPPPRQPEQAEQAQPVEKAFDVTIEDNALKMLDDMVSPSIDDECNPVRLIAGKGHSGYGLYICSEDYPEEGAELLAELPHLYTAPPPRKPLTDEEIDKAFIDHKASIIKTAGGNTKEEIHAQRVAITRAIEAAHGFKGEA